MASDRMTIRVDPQLRRRLVQAATKAQVPPSELVRTAIKKHLRQQPGESCYDLARRTGVIGVVKDAPRDLSTNRVHFRGFGKR